MPETLQHLCECDSYCALWVQIPFETAQELAENGWVVIVDGCKHGPSVDDRLIHAETGYKIYEPAEE